LDLPISNAQALAAQAVAAQAAKTKQYARENHGRDYLEEHAEVRRKGAAESELPTVPWEVQQMHRIWDREWWPVSVV
jgi:hypothetical protein